MCSASTAQSFQSLRPHNELILLVLFLHVEFCADLPPLTTEPCSFVSFFRGSKLVASSSLNYQRGYPIIFPTYSESRVSALLKSKLSTVCACEKVLVHISHSNWWHSRFQPSSPSQCAWNRLPQISFILSELTVKGAYDQVLF